MNRVHRSVWNAARQCFVATAETTRARGKPSSVPTGAVAGAAAVVLIGLGQPAWAQACNVSSATTTACVLNTGQSATISTTGSITIDASATEAGAVTVLTSEDAQFVTNDGTLEASGGKSGLALETDASLESLFNRGTIDTSGLGSVGVSVGSGATLHNLSNEPGIPVFGPIGTAATIRSADAAAIESYGAITTLTNGGLIEGQSGILLLDGASMTTLTNGSSGRIVATGSGGQAIGLSGTGATAAGITTLNNEGIIEGTGAGSYGLFLTGDTFITTLTNSGTIAGNRSGVEVDDPGVRITTFRNSGTIQGSTYAVRSTTPFGIQTIEILGNDTARFIGQVDAVNTKIVVNPGATYTLRSTDDFHTLGFENRGTVRFDSTTPTFDATHITQGFRNYGVLSLAAGQQATLTGNFEQFNDATLGNGVIRINVTDNTTYGQLSVDGNITLPANARFDVNVSNPNFVFTVTELADVITVGTSHTITWDGSHTTTDNSVLFDFAPKIDPANARSIMLDIIAASSNGGGAGNAVSATGNRVAAGAATVIDALSAAYASGGTGNADLDSFIGSLGTLTTDAQLAAAVESTLPVLQGAAPRINLGTQVNMAQAVQGRQQVLSGLSAGDAFADQRLWVKPFGTWGDQSNRNGAQGYDSTSYGIVVGADGEIRPNYRVGASLGYASSKADSNNRLNRIDVDSFLFSIYGSTNVSERTSVNWQAGYSHHSNEGRRSIPLPGLVAQSDYRSQGWQLGVGVDHAMPLSATTTFIPGVRLDYDRVRDKGYTETGAGGLNLVVNSKTTEQLVLGLNARFQFKLDDRSSLQADLGWGHDFNAKQNSITAAFVGGGAAFTTAGIQPSKSLWRAGVGYVSQTGNGVEVNARLDMQRRTSGQSDASASVNLRWAF